VFLSTVQFLFFSRHTWIIEVKEAKECYFVVTEMEIIVWSL